MKAIIIFFTTTLLFQMFISTATANNTEREAEFYKNIEIEEGGNGPSPEVVALAHSKSAKKQIKNFLAQSLKYTEIMRDYCVEGEAIISVKLNDKGELLEASVIDSPHSVVLDIIKAGLSKLDSISIKNKNYKGEKEFRLIISFFLS